MKRLLILAGFLCALALPLQAIASTHSPGGKPSTSTRKIYVKGYHRKDGTYVPPHYRSAPDSSVGTSPKKPSGGASAQPGHDGCRTCPRDEQGRIKRSDAARHEFMRQTGYPHGRPGYVIDHIVPLECGGADAPGNMQWQTVAEAKAKDRTERNCRR